MRLQSVLGQHQRSAAKAVGFDDVRSRLEILAMNIKDHVGSRAHQVFVAAFERRAPKIGRRKVALLQHGTHRAIQHEDAFRQQLPKSLFRFSEIPHSALNLAAFLQWQISSGCSIPSSIYLILRGFPARIEFIGRPDSRPERRPFVFNGMQASENTPYPSVTTREHRCPRSLPLWLAFTTLKYSGYETHVIQTYRLSALAAPSGAQRV